MSLKSLATAVVIALKTPEREAKLQKELKASAKKHLEFYLCEGSSNKALKTLGECRISRSETLFYTDRDVVFKYSSNMDRFIAEAARLVSPHNVFVV